MGRPKLVDTSNLVVLLPNNTCRCIACGKILAGLQRSNIKRHYQRLHPNIVLQRLPRPQKEQPKQSPVSADQRADLKMGRPQIVDTNKLAEDLPDGKRCRCKLCGKVLNHRPGNVRRHYSIFHPHIIVQLAPNCWGIDEDKLTPNRRGLLNPDPDPSQLQNRSASAGPTINLIDHQSRDGGDSEDNASGSQYDGIFIEKSEMPDLNPTDDESGSGDKDCEELMAEPPNSTTTAATPMKPHVTCASSSTSVINVATRAPSTPARLPVTGLPSSDDAFYLQYLGNKLSKYSSHTKNTVQYQINKILYKADMGCFEEADSKKDDSDF